MTRFGYKHMHTYVGIHAEHDGTCMNGMRSVRVEPVSVGVSHDMMSHSCG